MTQHERFEQWIESTYSPQKLRKTDQPSDYVQNSHGMWLAWQAAQPKVPDDVREAAEYVKCPNTSEHSFDVAMMKIVDWALKLIEEQTQ
jgi:hypothetical protein